MDINISNSHDVESIEVKTYGKKSTVPGKPLADLVLRLKGSGDTVVISFDDLSLIPAWHDSLETIVQYLC